jgi:hypothetical protein
VNLILHLISVAAFCAGHAGLSAVAGVWQEMKRAIKEKIKKQRAALVLNAEALMRPAREPPRGSRPSPQLNAVPVSRPN